MTTDSLKADPRKKPDTLLIQVVLGHDGYGVSYFLTYASSEHSYTTRCQRRVGMTRAEMVRLHVQVIREQQPSAVFISAAEGTAEVPAQVQVLPKVVKGIIEGKLTAAELTL